MGPPVDPVASDETLPARTGIVVIGGGIIGTCAALALARQGVAVTLCEKGHIAGEQSSRNWGWCRKTGRDPREFALITEALRQWETMNETVQAETGFRTCGVLYVSGNGKSRAGFETWLDQARPYQMGSRIVEGAELAALLPGAARGYDCALYTPGDGRAEPQKAAPAIALAARRAGAVILTECAVRGVDRQGGRVAGVVTERGRIACDGVILAGGAWSRLFLGNSDVRLPQLKVLASLLRTAPLPGGPEASAWVGEFAYRKRLDGGYSIANGAGNIVPLVPDTVRFFREFLPALKAEWSALRPRINGLSLQEARRKRRWRLDEATPFEETRVLDPAPDAKIIEQARIALQNEFPIFRSMNVVQQWGGMIDVTPDAVPVISPIDALPGLVVATGFSGHGFGIGPAAGRLAADLITGATPIVDPTPFRYSRFTDGSPIHIQSGL